MTATPMTTITMSTTVRTAIIAMTPQVDDTVTITQHNNVRYVNPFVTGYLHGTTHQFQNEATRIISFNANISSPNEYTTVE